MHKERIIQFFCNDEQIKETADFDDYDHGFKYLVPMPVKVWDVYREVCFKHHK